MTRISFRAVFPAFALLLSSASGVALAQQERTVDPDSAPTRTCQALVIDSVKEEFPKAKRIEWDMESVRESDVEVGLLLSGYGNYQGGSARRRFDFECIYDAAKEQVVSAWWVSSFDRQRHVVVDIEGVSGWTPAQITKACQAAVTDLVTDEFPGAVRKLALVKETIERSENRGLHELSGQGRFQGGGGTWRRVSFGCNFDENAEEVTEVTWAHLGAESDLDLD